MLRMDNLGVLLSLLTVLLLMLSCSSTQHPESNVASVGEDRPKPYAGVGFDLTLSYGVAAVRYTDGSFAAVAKIDGGSEYDGLMYRLSRDSSRHLHPPYKKAGDPIVDMPRQWKRAARKRLGLPASKDVGILSDLISSLRHKTEELLGQTIESVVVAKPRLVGLYEEDIFDALEYAGLQPLEIRSNCLQPVQLSAALAGNGYGLCQNYTQPGLCAAEERELPQETVLSVYYARNALESQLEMLQSAYIWGTFSDEREDKWILDWSAGSDALGNAPEDRYYWELIRERILELPVRMPYGLPITKVLVHGESSKDKTFLEVLIKAIHDLQGEAPQILYEDALYVAAKGAAEFAARAPWEHRPQEMKAAAREIAQDQIPFTTEPGVEEL